MNNMKPEIKSDFKAKANTTMNKTAKDTAETASDSAGDMLDTVAEFGKNFLHSMSGTKEKAVEVASTTLSSLDKKIRSRPMSFVGGAAVLGFVAGYFLGRGRTPTASQNISAGIDKLKDNIEKNINKVSEHLQ